MARNGFCACGAILSAAVISAVAPGLAQGASPGPETTGHLEPTVSFLQSAQNSDGGFGASVGSPSDPDISAWVALALAAASINPQYQIPAGSQAGPSVFSYLAEHAGELELTPDFARALLVVDAAGTSPSEFGKVNLTQRLLEAKLPEGSFPQRSGGEGSVIDTAFAVLALSPIHEEAAEQAVAKATEWLIQEQNLDGSWPASCRKIASFCDSGGESPAGEVDTTAAVVEALNAVGMHDTSAQQKAFGFLADAEQSGGGFVEFLSEPEPEAPNTASTAWAVQALWSADEQPEEEPWASGSGNPLQFLASMQQPNGSIRWRASEYSYPVWMTAYVTPAFAGRALPIPAVPPPAPPPQGESPPEASSSAPLSSAARAAAGVKGAKARHSADPHRGVIAGGGGRGARLFSRPQAQSQGDTPGGVRALEQGAASSASSASSASRGRTSSDPRSGHGKPVPGSATGDGAADEREVSGVLVGAPGSKRPGAPGLRSATASEASTPWTALAIAALVGLLVTIGALIERRRPQVIL